MCCGSVQGQVEKWKGGNGNDRNGSKLFFITKIGNMAISDILYTNRRKLQKAKTEFLWFSLISYYKRVQG